MALGLLVIFTPPAIAEYINYRWERQVDKNIPRLLRDLEESVRSGITLPRALEEASQREYGPISRELERAITAFLLGVSWDEALHSLARRLRRPSALRFCTILIEAQQTGGKITAVLETSVEVFSSLDEYREERYTQMRPYIMIVYMGVFTFLMIAHVVLYQFLTPLVETATDPMLQNTPFLGQLLDLQYYKSILFWASIIESLLGGLVAGKISDGVALTGLRHSIVLTVASILFFNIV